MSSVDDDDAWLYGENNAEEQRKLEISAIFDRATEDIVVPGEENVITTNGDIQVVGIEKESPAVREETKSQEKEEKDTDDDEDSDDDDVQITIGDIKPATSTYQYGGTPVNLNIKRGGAFSSATAGSGTKGKGIDIDTVGVINGSSIYEFNLDSIEDKPWRKPGADITDYFNYGFNEDTWKAYCEKQRKLRIDNDVAPKSLPLVPGKDQQIPTATVNENSKYSGMGIVAKKAGPPPGRRTSGSIDVICGANSSRRSGNSKENVIQVIGRDVYDSSLPPGLPPTHMPPPFIPPNLSVPPPGIPPGVPPPNIPPPPGTIPSHVPYTDMYGATFSHPPHPVPGVVDPTSQYDEQFFTGTSSHHFESTSESQNSWANSPQHRERDRDRNRDREKDRDHYWEERNRDRSGRVNEEEYKRRDREDYDRRRYRDYRDRRDKDRYDRDYDRDHHDKERDSREKDRERRHRDHKEREDRHKERSSRKRHHHDEDEEHYSSSRHKHKESKHKAEKDESSNSAVEGSETTQAPAETEEK